MLSPLLKFATPCLNPQRVVNPHTGETIIVPCRKCAQCLNIKAFSGKKLCESEALQHKYTFFVTLSYEESNLPKVRIEKTYHTPSFATHKGEQYYRIIDDCDRSKTKGHILSIISEKQLQQVTKLRYNPYKNHESPISYALKTDLQKYFKRLRKAIYKYAGEHIRYYAVSDYGGKHLRPHFHCLVHFSGYQTFQIFTKYAIEKWKLGNVDCSLSKGQCASYVASYVTGTHRRYALYNTPAFKTRSFHSNFYGIDYLKTYRKDVYNSPTPPFNGNSYFLPHGIAEFYRIPSLDRLFFPKVFRFREYTHHQLCFLYTLYYEITKGNTDIDCSMFLNSFFDWYDNKPVAIQNYISSILDMPDEINPTFIGRMQSLFYLGKHFHFFVCDHDKRIHRDMVRKIMDYYSSCDLLKLNKFYSEFERDNGYDYSLGLHHCLYPNEYTITPEAFDLWKKAFKATRAYELANIEASNILNDRIKHKKLSDIKTKGLI